MRKILLIGAIMLIASGAFAQSYPQWVANLPGTGAVKTWTSSVVESEGLSLIQITATSDMTCSFWRFNASASRGPTGWVKIGPLRWDTNGTVSDSLMVIPSGVTMAFRFPASARCQLINVVSGDGYFSGE